MLTTDATCARPIRSPAPIRSDRLAAGFAADSSQTAADWVTVTSSSTPSAPMTSPATTSPCRSIRPAKVSSEPIPSALSPVTLAPWMNSLPSTAVSASAPIVPTSATEV